MPLLQVFLTIAILMGEGLYMVGRVLLSSKWMRSVSPHEFAGFGGGCACAVTWSLHCQAQQKDLCTHASHLLHVKHTGAKDGMKRLREYKASKNLPVANGESSDSFYTVGLTLVAWSFANQN